MVTLPEAQALARARAKQGTASTLAHAVSTFVCTPALLIALTSLAAGMLASNQDPRSGLSGVGVAISLLIIATGLSIYLPTTWASSTYTALTHPGGSGKYSSWRFDGEEDEDPLISFMASIYWPSMVIIYLLWSFIFNAWGISWLVWPIAGILFGSLASARTVWRRMH